MASHRMARFIALAASCFALAVSAMPVREAPRAERPVAAMVVRSAPARQPRPPRAPARAASRSVSAPRPAPRAPRPRPLYLFHRSLLR
ncbi:MAG TPA: hypothetical protein VND93_25200 [Myxococcales bacterium]|nr:hypothetical protein [Myxococcales bacterium]